VLLITSACFASIIHTICNTVIDFITKYEFSLLRQTSGLGTKIIYGKQGNGSLLFPAVRNSG